MLRLLDVFVRHDAVLLVYPLFDLSLDHMCRQRVLIELEVKLVMNSLLQACAHLHRHGLVHADVKPTNVLVKGQGSATTEMAASAATQTGAILCAILS